MSPIRLLILAALGYILYRFLVGERSVRPGGEPSPLRGSQPAAGLLVEDPVCHTYIPQQGAEALTVAGKTHYFCSPECREKFQSEPRS